MDVVGLRWVIVLAAVTLAACDGGPGDRPRSTQLGTVDALPETTQLGAVGEAAGQLADSIQPVIDCSGRQGPADDLQSPVLTAQILCDESGTAAMIFTFADPRGLHFQLEATTVGTTAAARVALVGADWVIFAPRAKLEAVNAVIGGTLYTDQQQALKANPGYSEADDFPSCHLFLTGVLANYGATGDPVELRGLDEYAYPGILDEYLSRVGNLIPLLPHFNSGDVVAAMEDLVPYAEALRPICRAVA